MPWLFPAGGNLHPSQHSHTLGRKIHKGSHLSEKWMPCVYSQTPPPPRLALEMLPSLGYVALGCVVALRLHFMWIYMSRPGMINAHDFVVLLTRFNPQSYHLLSAWTLSMDKACGLSAWTQPFWASVCLCTQWTSECHVLEWSLEFKDVLSVVWLEPCLADRSHLLNVSNCRHSVDASVWKDQVD